jgi:hypothetical protein
MENNKDIFSRQFGLGASPTDTNAWQQACCCPFTQTPVVEYTTQTAVLPLSDSAITSTFGDQINILNFVGHQAGITSLDTSFISAGILQTNLFCTGIGIHFFSEPESFSTIGNSIATSITTTPVSPDVWTHNDVINGALGASLATSPGSIIPAVFEWGMAAWNAMWNLANGYQFIWTFCQRYQLLNELVADLCYFSSYAEGEGFGTSDVAVQQYVKQVNATYRSLSGGSVFMLPNYRRVGAVNVTGTGGSLTGTGTGVFHPTSDYQVAPVSWGGIRNQGGTCCQPFRKMAKPIFLQAGLPIGMRLQAQDQYNVTQMQRYLSISEGAGTNTTALVQQDSTLNGYSIAATGVGVAPAGLELTLDQGGNQFASQSVNTDRALFKGGQFKMATLLKGFEVGGQWLGCFKDPQTAQQLSSQVYIPNMQGTSGMAGVGLLGGSSAAR